MDKELGNARLSLDERRLALDKQKYEQDHELERQKNFWSIVALAGPLIAGVAAYIFQIWTRKREEALQFELKAAEIVMNARDTNEAKNKAELLTMLFRGRLQALELALGKEQFPYFGRSVERREELLKTLAQYPETRADVIRAWELFFPWDGEGTGWSKKSAAEKKAYNWFNELKKDELLNKNRANPAKNRRFGRRDPS